MLKAIHPFSCRHFLFCAGMDRRTGLEKGAIPCPDCASLTVGRWISGEGYGCEYLCLSLSTRSGVLAVLFQNKNKNHFFLPAARFLNASFLSCEMLWETSWNFSRLWGLFSFPGTNASLCRIITICVQRGIFLVRDSLGKAFGCREFGYFKKKKTEQAKTKNTQLNK